MESWSSDSRSQNDNGGSHRCPPPAPLPGVFGDECELEVGNDEGEEKKGRVNHHSHLDSELLGYPQPPPTRPGGNGTFIAMMISQEIFVIMLGGL